MSNPLRWLWLAVLPLAAQAAEPPAAGAETRTWLELQRNGAAAPRDARPMPGEVADRVYQRYLQSFTHPIPERFETESFTEGSGGSGG